MEITPIQFISLLKTHNPNGVDALLLNQVLELKYIDVICKSYNSRKAGWNFISDMNMMNEEDLIASLVIHSYNADLTESHFRRSFNSTKLIDFISQDLKNTNDYLNSRFIKTGEHLPSLDLLTLIRFLCSPF